MTIPPHPEFNGGFFFGAPAYPTPWPNTFNIEFGGVGGARQSNNIEPGGARGMLVSPSTPSVAILFFAYGMELMDPISRVRIVYIALDPPIVDMI